MHRRPCPLSCQCSWNWAQREVQVHFHHCPLGSEMSRGSWERLPVRLETLRVRQANKQVVPSQPPHHRSSFPHPPGVQQNKVEPEHHGADAGSELPRPCSGKGDAVALDDTTQWLWINCVLLWGRSLGDQVRLKSSSRTFCYPWRCPFGTRII